MNLRLSSKNLKIDDSIEITGSKSESNRLLILQLIIGGFDIENLSNSDDTKVLQNALQTSEKIIDVGHAGTAMRFLTAFFATQEGREVVLTGSERMQQRPIKILVDALKDLGANINYEKNIGYPPIRIKGTKFQKDNVQIQGNVSSQYISALALIAPSLPNGLQIELVGKITSIPYIKMTISLLNELGVEVNFSLNKISVKPLKQPVAKVITIESDWSSASYFYSCIALSEVGSKLKLTSYKKESLQGDSRLSEIYKHFGVHTTFSKNAIVISKEKEANLYPLELDLQDAPDIAQTIVVTCFGLGISCHIKGLHTLKIKETDRLVALQNELVKLGASVQITKESLYLEENNGSISNVKIATYNDHRMAMAFAPLALKIPITILDAEVVSKSYVNFWEDLQQIGFQIEKE